MDFENVEKELDNLLKRKLLPPDELIYDVKLLNTVSRKVNKNMSLNTALPINPYREKLLDKKKVREYNLYCENLLYNIDLFLECCESYLKLLNEMDFISDNNYNCSTNYTLEETTQLLYSFFSSLGDEEYNFIKEYGKNDKIFFLNNLKDEETARGQFYNMRSLKKFYIFMKYEGKIDISLMMYLAHELGHAYEYIKSSDRHNKFNNVTTKHMVEITSSFYEYEFLRYLKSNNINMFETIALINLFYNYAKLWCEELNESLNTDMIVSNNKLYVLEARIKPFINCDYELIKVFREYTDELKPTGKLKYFSADIDNPILYGIGSYTAFHLSKLKEEDPQYFKKVFNDFLTTRTLMNYSTIIEMICMDKEKFLSGELIKPQIEANQKLYRKQLNINI